jgi:hypothetical protein
LICAQGKITYATTSPKRLGFSGRGFLSDRNKASALGALGYREAMT